MIIASIIVLYATTFRAHRVGWRQQKNGLKRFLHGYTVPSPLGGMVTEKEEKHHDDAGHVLSPLCGMATGLYPRGDEPETGRRVPSPPCGMETKGSPPLRFYMEVF